MGIEVRVFGRKRGSHQSRGYIPQVDQRSPATLWIVHLVKQPSLPVVDQSRLKLALREDFVNWWQRPSHVVVHVAGTAEPGVRSQRDTRHANQADQHRE